MITFNNQKIFDSGQAVLYPKIAELRTQEHVSPTGKNIALHSLGHQPRLYEQHGTLIADTPDQVRERMVAIEALMDGLTYPLVDDFLNLSVQAVLIRIHAQPLTAVGPRFKTDYILEYLVPHSPATSC